MHTTEIGRRLAVGYVPFPEGRIEQTAISLRKAGHLPESRRGLSAVDLTTNEIAKLFLGLCAPAVASAAEFAKTWGDMKADEHLAVFKDDRTLGEILTRILLDDIDALGIDRLEINTDWPEAKIIFDNGAVVNFSTSDRQRRASGYQQTPMYRLAVFGAGFFTQFAHELAESRKAA